MPEWPTFLFGVFFVLGAGLMLITGPAQYQATRRLPKWMLPASRLWPERLDVWVARAVAVAGAGFGIALIIGSFFV